MDNNFKHTNNTLPSKPFEYDREIQLLRNMESVHNRKKAAFDELLRFTYNNIKQTEPDQGNE